MYLYPAWIYTPEIKHIPLKNAGTGRLIFLLKWSLFRWHSLIFRGGWYMHLISIQPRNSWGGWAFFGCGSFFNGMNFVGRKFCPCHLGCEFTKVNTPRNSERFSKYKPRTQMGPFQLLGFFPGKGWFVRIPSGDRINGLFSPTYKYLEPFDGAPCFDWRFGPYCGGLHLQQIEVFRWVLGMYVYTP